MTVSELIYFAENQKLPEYKGDTTCVFCGKPAQKNLKKVIKKTFTDLDYLQKGEGVCEACKFCLDDKNAIRKKSAVYHKGGVLKFTALELEDIVFNLDKYNIEPPFFFAVSYSKKKHMFYKGDLSFNFKKFFIQTDDIGFEFDVNEYKEVFNLIKELYTQIPGKKQTYFTKGEIMSLSPPIYKIKNFGLDRFYEIKQKLEKYRKNPAYEMLVYAVRIKESK
jgi:hypothetical protein